jgi:chemotaxis response regulator CheB
LIQDPRGAARRAMPDAAIAATVADAVLPVEEIANFLYGLWMNPVVSAVTEAR